MCLEGTTSIVNLVAIVQGRRDPVAAKIAPVTAAVTVGPVLDTVPLASKAMMEAANEFSADRVNLVQAGGFLPTVLAPGPRLLIHFIPLCALREGAGIDHTTMRRVHGRFKPAHYEKFTARTTIDGWLLWQPPQAMPPLPNPVSSWSSMVTNAGIVEIVETLAVAGQNDPPPSVKGYPLEADIVATLDQIADGFGELHIASAAVLKAMLFGAQGVRLERSRPGYADGFDRSVIMLPDVYLEEITKPIGNQLRPMFDALWRAAGWSDGSQSFSRGEWAGYGEGRIR